MPQMTWRTVKCCTVEKGKGVWTEERLCHVGPPNVPDRFEEWIAAHPAEFNVMLTDLYERTDKIIEGRERERAHARGYSEAAWEAMREKAARDFFVAKFRPEFQSEAERSWDANRRAGIAWR